MADRSITARLRLVYSEFTRGTDAAAKGLRGIGTEAAKTSKSVGRDWGALGERVSDLGKSMTTRVTLPLVGLGVAAVKVAGDFDNAFTQMQTLSGLTAGEVDSLKESVLGLAGEVGKSPQELAEALYFLRSSGLDSAAAMDALEMSAKASAAGLGDTVTIADAVSSAMLGYAEAGLTAAEATDVLVATAQAGKAEPAELAGQMGRLIPIAAELGISFADVGGAVAALSTKGNSASDATTQLVNVMGKLLKPSQQATEQLEAVGLSTDRIRELIAEKGLLGTLEVLRDRLGDSGLARFMEDQQAVIGVMGILGGDLEKTREIFDQVNNSAGETDKAFQVWAENMGSQNAKAFANFQIALIRLGDIIAPIAADLLGFAANAVQIFGELPGPIQRAAVAALALAAAAGPLTTVAGKLMKGWGVLVKVWDRWSSAGGRAFADAMNQGSAGAQNLARNVGPMGAAGGLLALEAAAVIALVAIHDMGQQAHNARIEDLTAQFMKGSDMADLFAKALDGDKFAMADVNEILKNLIDTNLAAAERFVDAAEAAGAEEDAVAGARKAIEDKRSSDAQAAVDSEANQEAIESTTLAMADQEEAVNEAAEAFRNYADTIKAAVDPVFGLLNALRQNQDAQRGVVEAQVALDEAIKEHGRNSTEAAEATIALQEAMIGVGDSALGVTTAAAELNAAVAENPGLVDDALDALQTWRDQGIIPTDEQLRFLQEQIKQTALEGVALGGVDPTIDVTETGTRNTRTQLRTVRDAAHDIPTRRNTSVNASGTSHATGLINQVRDALDRLHDRTVRVNIVLNDPSGVKLSALSGQRARGGPVHKNRLYEVGEGGAHELLRTPGHTYLIPGSEGTVVPAGTMSSAASLVGAGGNVTNVFVDMGRGIFVGTQRQFRTAVVEALNTVQRKGRGMNAA